MLPFNSPVVTPFFELNSFPSLTTVNLKASQGNDTIALLLVAKCTATISSLAVSYPTPKLIEKLTNVSNPKSIYLSIYLLLFSTIYQWFMFYISIGMREFPEIGHRLYQIR